VVKPRTQVLLTTHGKGVIVDGAPSEIASAYARFRRANPYGPAFASRFPEATWPMLQRYHAQAMDGIYSLAGFRTEDGHGFAVLAENKVLQRPRRLGIGLCFEPAAVDAQLAERVRRLCERVGYFGIFEVEFIREGERSLLIDMNGRLYNQIAFDVARGLPLPQLAYAEALGHHGEVARLLESTRRVETGTTRGFCNRFGLEVLVAAKRATGRMSHDDAARWRAWCDERNGNLVDAVADRDDPRPFAFEVAAQLYGYLRHPLSFVRTIALDG
jgi:predicted ATP-grasp superfamily ATP-dependent carboligase